MPDHKFLYKQVIVVREDLKMSPGKLAVQVAHASVGAFVAAGDIPEIRKEWFLEGFRKVVLKVPSALEIIKLEGECYDSKIPCYAVYDFGLTELEPHTLTCIGIGPDVNENVDKITGRLGLYK
jgi:peptidyl-tRNA hydrolase, PTH2 family